jgi:hypothetical protein
MEYFQGRFGNKSMMAFSSTINIRIPMERLAKENHRKAYRL